MKISNLSSFILSESPRQLLYSQTLPDHRAEVKVDWLFPQELELIGAEGIDC